AANNLQQKDMQISDLLELPMQPPPSTNDSTSSSTSTASAADPFSHTSNTASMSPMPVYLTSTAPMQSIAYEPVQPMIPIVHTSERAAPRTLAPLSIPMHEISPRIHLAAYPSPPTDILDQSAQENIISDILLNSPTASPSSNCPLSPIEHVEHVSHFLPSQQHHLYLACSPVSDTTDNAFIYPQIGRPTSSKCERFMEFMKANKLRRVTPRSPRELGVRRSAVDAVFKAPAASRRITVPLPSERISSVVVFGRDSSGRL
ncbi:hypothetical protein HDU81_009402, partial [Chytriomyces hyalinus]